MSMVLRSKSASEKDRTKSGDHDSVIALGFIALILIFLAVVFSLLGSPQDIELLVAPA